MPAKARDRIISATPPRRLAVPEEIARTAVFILQTDSCTGRILEIDGGLRI